MLVVIVAVMIAAVSVFSMQSPNEDVFTYSDLVELFENDLVRSFNVDGNWVITLKALKPVHNQDGSLATDENGNPVYEKNAKGEFVYVEHSYAFTNDFQLSRIEKFALEGNSKGEELRNLETYNFERPAETPWYVLYLPYIIVGILVIALMIFTFRSAGAGGGKGGGGQ
jgi:ATP-dependent Zn protease